MDEEETKDTVLELPKLDDYEVIENVASDPIDRIFGSEGAIEIQEQTLPRTGTQRVSDKKLSKWLLYLLIAIGVSILVLIPGLFLYHVYGDSIYCRIFLMMSLFVFGFYGSLSFLVALPLLLVALQTNKDLAQHTIVTLRSILSLRQFVSFSFASALNVAFLKKIIPCKTDSMLCRYIHSCSMALCIFSFGLLAERLLLQRIAVYFHSQNYKTRIQQNNFGLAMVQRLRSILNRSSRAGLTRVDDSLKKPVDQQSSYQYATRVQGMQQSSQTSSSIPPPTTAGEDDEDIGVSMDPTMAEDLARTIYYSLIPHGASHLEPKDFVIAFERDKDVSFEQIESFFYILDTDENGDLTLMECVAGVVNLYQERDVLTRALASNTEVIWQLHNILMAVIVAFVGILCLRVFNATIRDYITTLTSIVLALQYFVEGSASSAVSCIIFVLVTHPFDVGDRIMVDSDAIYTITKLELWVTAMVNSTTGALTYVHNDQLAQHFISNLRRSPPQHDFVLVRIHSKTTREQLDALEKHLHSFLVEHNREYEPSGLRISTFNIENIDSIRLDFRLEYRSNFQDAHVRSERLVKFQMYLKESLETLAIRLAPYHWE